MNEASFLETWKPFRGIRAKRFVSSAGTETDAPPPVALPPVDGLTYDLAYACRKRYSPESDFVPGQVGVRDVAALLKEAIASYAYRNDLDESAEHAQPRVCLYTVLHGVEGIPDGAYRYDSAAHALRRVRSGDFRRLLQGGMALNNVNLFRVPICLHVVGDKNHLKAELGYRGYRIAQMEAGMLVQRILLAASAVGMGGHPLLDFDADLCDRLYNLAPLGATCLIQVPVGRLRHRPRLEGSLHG
jgi:SagB-type dehydrogenase family enzyme